jgi:hypothetical protein
LLFKRGAADEKSAVDSDLPPCQPLSRWPLVSSAAAIAAATTVAATAAVSVSTTAATVSATTTIAAASAEAASTAASTIAAATATITKAATTAAKSASAVDLYRATGIILGIDHHRAIVSFAGTLGPQIFIAAKREMQQPPFAGIHRAKNIRLSGATHAL